MTLRKLLFRILIVLISSPFLVLLFIYVNYHLISFMTSSRIYDDTDKIPYTGFAIVMGAGNYEPDQWINYAFNSRMNAAYQLFKSGKAGKIIVSGLEMPGVFSEPMEMKQVLMEMGVPDSAIITDNQGVRTWASMQRVKDHFKINNIIVISQQGQLERALFIASCLDIDAVGFTAQPSPHYYRYWIRREYLARVKCIADCFAYHLKIY